jgi:hypothetical protein
MSKVSQKNIGIMTDSNKRNWVLTEVTFRPSATHFVNSAGKTVRRESTRYLLATRTEYLAASNCLKLQAHALPELIDKVNKLQG